MARAEFPSLPFTVCGGDISELSKSQFDHMRNDTCAFLRTEIMDVKGLIWCLAHRT